MFVSKGGIGYGVDETQKVEDDGKGWVWLAAEMSPGGLALELFKSVPYGKRALLVAKQSNVDDFFAKVNWDQVTANLDKTFGGPDVIALQQAAPVGVGTAPALAPRPAPAQAPAPATA